MRQNNGFVLSKIDNIPYLLPYGQMLADRKRGIQINDTGTWLWNLLEQEHSLEEVFALSAEYYDIQAQDLDAFQDDIHCFIKQLLAYGILLDESGEYYVKKNGNAAVTDEDKSLRVRYKVGSLTSFENPWSETSVHLSCGGMW